MNDTRPSLLLAVALILLVLSLTLLGTWAYYSHKNAVPVITAGAENMLPKEPAIPATPAAQDSLQYMYAATIRELDIQADSTQKNIDSLKSHMDIKLIESGRLRAEITTLMRSGGGMSTDEVAMVKQKIAALQQKVEELKRINQGVDEENRRLKMMLANLASQQANGNGYTTAQYRNAVEPITAVSNAIAVSELRLQAVQVNNEREQETTDAQQAEKMVGSFIAKGNGAAGDLMVVVTQPDGRVLQNSTWDSGTFDTREGKRVYSVKMRYDQSRNESRPYLFSINAERFQKGSYTLQIYQNGVMIARLVKTLS